MLFSTRKRVLLILGPLYTALAFGMTALAGCHALEKLTWQVFQGRQLHARLGDFTPGTTRHSHSWDEVRDDFAACVEAKLGVKVTSPIDTLFRGGIWITAEQYSRYVFWNAPDSLTQKPRLEMGHWSYRDGDVLEHELGHAFIHDFPKLRNPLDSLGQQGELDHASPLFHACVHYCPPSESGCRQ